MTQTAAVLPPTQRLQSCVRDCEDDQYLSRAPLKGQIQDKDPILASLHRLLQQAQPYPKQL
jgi:hypothetical protein